MKKLTALAFVLLTPFLKAVAPLMPDQDSIKRLKQVSQVESEAIKAAPAGAKAPKKNQRVSVHYTGWREDNGQLKKFDSSVDRGKPFEFVLGTGQVIAGWDEAVATMKVGEKRRVYLPAKKAYGTRGAGGLIPPNANLMFDIELLEVK